MEIIDYLRLLKGRLVLLIGIPLLAAVVMAGVSYSLEPQTYRAQATVAVAPGQGRIPREVDQTIENYLAAATTLPILEQVSESTGVTVGRLRRGLSLRRLGESSFIEVSFVSQDPQDPPKVVRAVGHATVAFLFERQLHEAHERVAETQRTYEAVEAKIQDLVGQAGGVALSLPELYKQRQSELSALNVSRANAAARGDGSAVANLDKIIAQRAQELRSLQPLALEYNRLAAEREVALDNRGTAEQALLATEQQLDPDGEFGVVAATETAVAVPLPIVRRTVAAGGTGLFIGIGLVALLELAAARRRQPHRQTEIAPRMADPSATETRRDGARSAEAPTAGIAPVETASPGVAAPEGPVRSSVVEVIDKIFTGTTDFTVLEPPPASPRPDPWSGRQEYNSGSPHTNGPRTL